MQPSDSTPRRLARHKPLPGKGNAGIYYSERADGTRMHEVRVKKFNPETGKWTRKYEPVSTRLDQAKKRRAEVMTAEVRGERIDADAPRKMHELIVRFRANHKISPDKDRVLDRIDERWGHEKLRNIQWADIAAWWPTLERLDGREGELDDATKHKILGYFSTLMEYAVEINALSSNPVRAIPRRRRPKAPEARRRTISPDEEARLHAYAAPFKNADGTSWLSDIITVTLDEALRLRETLALQWSDIDFVNNKVRVYHALDRWTGELGPTKHTKLTGKRDPRDLHPIDLMPRAREVLLRLRMDSDGTGLVFRNKLGGTRLARDVQRAFHKAVQRAALPVTADGPVVFHSLRHTCISRLANNPAVPLVYARDHAGHTDIATTNTYLHRVESQTVTEAAAKALSGEQS
jgi:integrase